MVIGQPCRMHHATPGETRSLTRSPLSAAIPSLGAPSARAGVPAIESGVAKAMPTHHQQRPLPMATGSLLDLRLPSYQLHLGRQQHIFEPIHIILTPMHWPRGVTRASAECTRAASGLFEQAESAVAGLGLQRRHAGPAAAATPPPSR